MAMIRGMLIAQFAGRFITELPICLTTAVELLVKLFYIRDRTRARKRQPSAAKIHLKDPNLFMRAVSATPGGIASVFGQHPPFADASDQAPSELLATRR
jgi:hypothetical protein